MGAFRLSDGVREVTGCANECPRYLYRFVRYDRLCGIITSSRLYVPPVTKLNDPFEGIVKLVPGHREKETQELEKIQARVNHQMCELSFSGAEDAVFNPLLWSHYADGHRGACLKFDMQVWAQDYYPSSSPPGYVLWPVNYQMERPLVDFEKAENDNARLTGFMPNNAQANTDPLKNIAFTKHKLWGYEQEWRMMCSRTDKEAAIYLTFPPEVLTEIILGSQMPEERRQDIWCLVKGLGRSTQVCESQLDDKVFRIRVNKTTNVTR